MSFIENIKDRFDMIKLNHHSQQHRQSKPFHDTEPKQAKYSNTGGKATTIAISLAIAGVAIWSAFHIGVDVDSTEIVVVQFPITGTLVAHTEPGWKLRMFGTVTKYPRRDQFSFSADTSQGSTHDESISTQFNDGGKAAISGVINWVMPLTPEDILRLHRDFGSAGAIEQQLMRTALQKVIYSVGPTMSSIESSSERKSEIPQYIDDQLYNGPYLTAIVREMKPDPITNEPKMTNVVVIERDPVTKKPIRESTSQITAYKIQLQPVSINAIVYEPIVRDQIAERQKSTTNVQLSIANARKAEQAAITTEQEGKAKAAEARWAQETIKATAVTKAQQELEVATLAAKEAEQYKKEQILRGEGEAARKQLVMNADGALADKLAAMVEIQKVWASAIGSYSGQLVPSVVMGAQSGGTPSAMSSVMDLVALSTAQASKALAVDLSTSGKTATGKK